MKSIDDNPVINQVLRSRHAWMKDNPMRSSSTVEVNVQMGVELWMSFRQWMPPEADARSEVILWSGITFSFWSKMPPFGMAVVIAGDVVHRQEVHPA